MKSPAVARNDSNDVDTVEIPESVLALALSQASDDAPIPEGAYEEITSLDVLLVE